MFYALANEPEKVSQEHIWSVFVGEFLDTCLTYQALTEEVEDLDDLSRFDQEHITKVEKVVAKFFR